MITRVLGVWAVGPDNVGTTAQHVADLINEKIGQPLDDGMVVTNVLQVNTLWSGWDAQLNGWHAAALAVVTVERPKS